jgi:hypothetical protein
VVAIGVHGLGALTPAQKRIAAARAKEAAKAAAAAKKQAQARQKAAVAAAKQAYKQMPVVGAQADVYGMLISGGKLVGAPAGYPASRSDAFILYHNVTYRANFATVNKARVQAAAKEQADTRVTNIQQTAVASVAAGAPVAAAVSSAFAQDAQQNATPLSMLAQGGGAYEGGPSMLTQQPSYDGQPMLSQQPQAYGGQVPPWQQLQPEPSDAEVATGELVDVEVPSDVETQQAADAVEEAAVDAEEGPLEYQVVSPEEEQQLYERSQAEQMAALRVASAKKGRAEGYGGGFFGLGATAQAKFVARRAAVKAVQRGAPPAHAVAVGQRVARQFMADAGWAVARPGQGRRASAWADPSF